MIVKQNWNQFVKDVLKYDTLKNIKNLTMPILLIVGDKDNATPLSQHKIIYDKLKSDKELHIIKGAEHTFRERKHLIEIKKIFNKWIKKTNK